MTDGRILALGLALALGACGTGIAARPAPSTLPPALVADCVDYVLLDGRCTCDWYRCVGKAGDKGSCAEAWESCCRLPGQGAGSSIGRAQPASD